ASGSGLGEGGRPGSRPSTEDVELGAAEPEAAHEEDLEPAGAARGAAREGRAPSPRTARVGGGGGGAAGGLALGVGLAHMRGGGGTAAPKGGGPGPAPVAAPPKPTLAERLGHLRSGDLGKAGEAGIEQIDENNTDELAARGEYRWLSHLQKQATAGAKVSADD